MQSISLELTHQEETHKKQTLIQTDNR